MSAGKYIILKEGEQEKALVVSYGKKASQALLQAWKSGDTQPPSGGVSSAIIDGLSRAIPAISTGLANGHVFQVVGTPALLEGISAGTHALVQTSSGSLGTVVSTSTGQIAGQLRFAPSTMAPVVAPALTWAVINGLAGTMQLQRINQRLDLITRKLEQVQFRQEATELGKISAAAQILEEILLEYEHLGRFSSLSISRLALAERDIRSSLERNKVLLNGFSGELKAIKERKGSQGAESASALYEEKGETFMMDLALLNGLIAAQAMAFRAHLLHDIAQDPEAVEFRLQMTSDYITTNQDQLDAYPDISELSEHIEQCLADMSWLERNIIRRATTSRAKRVIASPRMNSTKVRANEPLPNIAFWKEDGKLLVKLVDPDT